MLLAPSEITIAALRTDLPLQRHHAGSIRLQLLALKEGLSVVRSLETTVVQRHTIAQGDNLQIISQRIFGTPDYWRTIADMNKIEYPYLVYPGQILEIPDA